MTTCLDGAVCNREFLRIAFAKVTDDHSEVTLASVQLIASHANGNVSSLSLVIEQSCLLSANLPL